MRAAHPTKTDRQIANRDTKRRQTYLAAAATMRMWGVPSAAGVLFTAPESRHRGATPQTSGAPADERRHRRGTAGSSYSCWQPRISGDDCYTIAKGAMAARSPRDAFWDTNAATL